MKKLISLIFVLLVFFVFAGVSFAQDEGITEEDTPIVNDNDVADIENVDVTVDDNSDDDIVDDDSTTTIDDNSDDDCIDDDSTTDDNSDDDVVDIEEIDVEVNDQDTTTTNTTETNQDTDVNVSADNEGTVETGDIVAGVSTSSTTNTTTAVQGDNNTTQTSTSSTTNTVIGDNNTLENSYVSNNTINDNWYYDYYYTLYVDGEVVEDEEVSNSSEESNNESSSNQESSSSEESSNTGTNSNYDENVYVTYELLPTTQPDYEKLMNTSAKVYSLPKTGEEAPSIYIAIGLILMVIGTTMFVFRKQIKTVLNR